MGLFKEKSGPASINRPENEFELIEELLSQAVDEICADKGEDYLWINPEYSFPSKGIYTLVQKDTIIHMAFRQTNDGYKYVTYELEAIAMPSDTYLEKIGMSVEDAFKVFKERSKCSTFSLDDGSVCCDGTICPRFAGYDIEFMRDLIANFIGYKTLVYSFFP